MDSIDSNITFYIQDLIGKFVGGSLSMDNIEQSMDDTSLDIQSNESVNQSVIQPYTIYDDDNVKILDTSLEYFDEQLLEESDDESDDIPVFNGNNTKWQINSDELIFSTKNVEVQFFKTNQYTLVNTNAIDNLYRFRPKLVNSSYYLDKSLGALYQKSKFKFEIDIIYNNVTVYKCYVHINKPLSNTQRDLLSSAYNML